ncbi:MAG: glycosyltransferase family 39 protein [Ardenticatenales bacterium]|nr:glycosyltransferase family 39 protein [Ardenticatenales bacterium]
MLQRSNRSNRSLFPAAVLLLAFALRLFRLTAQSFWYDEGFTVYFAKMPLGEQLAALQVVSPIPFHYLLVSGWMRLAGESPYVLRYLSVMGSVLAVGLCYRLGRELGGPRVGLLAALGLTLSPMHIYYAQEVRTYGWLSALMLASALLLQRVPRGLSWKETLALGIVQALTLLAHIYSAFTLLALNLLLLGIFLLRRGPWETIRPWLLANGISLLLTAPWFWAARQTAISTALYFRGTVPLPTLLWQMVQAFSVGEASPTLWQGALLFLALAVLALLVALWQRLEWPWRFALTGALAPVVGILLASLERTRYTSRYTIAALPFFFLLFAMSWHALWKRWRPVGAAYGLLLLLLFGYMGLGGYNQFYDPAFFRPDFRAVSGYIQEHGDPAQDGIVLVGGHFHPILRYFLGETFALYPMPDNIIHNVDDPLNYRDLATLNEAAAQHRRLWLVLWQRELADPAGMVLDQLVGHTLRHIVFGEFGEIDLLLFEMPQAGVTFDTDPTPQMPLAHEWPGRVALRGYTLEPGATVNRGQPLHLTLFWRALAEMDEDFFASVQLIGADGQLYAQADHIAYNDFYPSSQWRAGEELLDRYQLDLPSALPPGRYQLILVLYDRAGSRWLTPERREFVELVAGIEIK